MTKIKSKKIMFVVLMGIIACLASLVVCFGQNAYADEGEGSNGRAGYIALDSGTEEDFYNSDGLIDLCNNKYRSEKTIHVFLEEDLISDGHSIHVDSGRTFYFDFKNHRMYNCYPKENSFFWVAGTLYLTGDFENHGILEAPRDTTNSSIIVDGGQIHVNNIDFVNTVYSSDDCPKYGGHVYFIQINSESNFTNCKFSGAKAEKGGSIYIEQFTNKSCIYFKDCAFENCCSTKADGGAILDYSTQVCLKLENISFKNCHSEKRGGAIYTFASYPNIYEFNNVTFEDCSAKESGGAADLGRLKEEFKNVTYKLTNCEFKNCHAGDNGGAMYSSAVCNLEVNDTKFENCSSDEGGAIYNAIYAEEKDALNNCTINNCKARQGGAIFNYYATERIVDRKKDYEFNNTHITNCESTEEGGAIYINHDEGNYYFKDSIIDSCHAKNDGGAIFVKSCDCKFLPKDSSKFDEACLTIKNCKSDTEGGAIYTSNATSCGNNIRFEKIDFIGNNAEKHGGGVCAYGSDNELVNCTFKDNYSGKEGGGLYQWRHMTLDNCNFLHNNCGEHECTEIYSDSKITCHIKNRICYLERFNAETAFGDFDGKNWKDYFNDPFKPVS
ncbi:MAG: hypothetical protein Q4E88_06780 [Coriobacteriia bacterium]|nr:hypothetical protein [Coriobacteriia bacterium]